MVLLLIFGVNVASRVCLGGQTIDMWMMMQCDMDHLLHKMAEPPKGTTSAALAFSIGYRRHGQEYTVEKAKAESNMCHYCH